MDGVETAARALETLHDIVRTWLKDEPFHLFIAGSYRLGTLPVGDIDVVLVVRACAVSRTRIFTELYSVLLHHAAVTQLTAVPGARVPLLGFFLNGQEFDLLTCHLFIPRDMPWPSREHLLQSYAPLNGADDASVIAFSGARVTEWLCSRLLPHFVAFRGAVQTLRQWAKSRALYSNKCGFLGGINLVLLAAAAAVQLAAAHADVTETSCVARAFAMCATRKWGVRAPLEIDGEYERRLETCPVFLYALDWDARAAAASDAMVLLTPCFPRTNSLFAVTSHTAAVLRREFRRAHALLTAAEPCALAASLNAPLEELPSCTQMLRVTFTAPNHSSGRQWLGFMEAQIRHLMRYVHEQARQLGLRAFRHIPTWTDEAAADATAVTRATHAIAEPMPAFAVKASSKTTLQAITEYFIREHASSGPARPPGTRIDAAFVPAHTASHERAEQQRPLLPLALALASSSSSSSSSYSFSFSSSSSKPTAVSTRSAALITCVLEARPAPPPAPSDCFSTMTRIRVCLTPAFEKRHARLLKCSAEPCTLESCTYVGPAWPSRGLAASVLWDVKPKFWSSSAAARQELDRIVRALPHTLWCPCAKLRTCHVHDIIAALRGTIAAS